MHKFAERHLCPYEPIACVRKFLQISKRSQQNYRICHKEKGAFTISHMHMGFFLEVHKCDERYHLILFSRFDLNCLEELNNLGLFLLNFGCNLYILAGQRLFHLLPSELRFRFL